MEQICQRPRGLQKQQAFQGVAVRQPLGAGLLAHELLDAVNLVDAAAIHHIRGQNIVDREPQIAPAQEDIRLLLPLIIAGVAGLDFLKGRHQLCVDHVERKAVVLQLLQVQLNNLAEGAIFRVRLFHQLHAANASLKEAGRAMRQTVDHLLQVFDPKLLQLLVGGRLPEPINATLPHIFDDLCFLKLLLPHIPQKSAHRLIRNSPS
mmetsp:Transcript_84360/g.202220  ORF Transcript_84360/g.202220 Transcript_84360/m.202220 type:complete len:206 (+) Transcript_84360:669-1286(+)